MHNYIAVVFNDTSRAYEGLHALWELDRAEQVTVHGTAVVHRDNWGVFEVDTKETHPAVATAVGVGIGALLGALAGPAGAAVGAARGAAIGAASGGVVGVATDVVRADTRAQAADETRFVLDAGQSAVIADVSEDLNSTINERMRSLGGTVYRRSASDLEDDAWFDDYIPSLYLYPYEYVPPAYR
ncbi:MAG TPA: hypothetical protein VLV56_17145 [Burkholderiales bacterium]|nr:hypothetical protein [Burkholderiales bacterium]HUP09025.1 hypothetical protein [Caldimonas sp.]